MDLDVLPHASLEEGIVVVEEVDGGPVDQQTLMSTVTKASLRYGPSDAQDPALAVELALAGCPGPVHRAAGSSRGPLAVGLANLFDTEPHPDLDDLQGSRCHPRPEH